MNIKVNTKRIIAGSAIGALCSLIILLPPLGGILNILIKIVLSAIMVITAYGKSDIRFTIKTVTVFFLTTFTFCGIILALWYIVYPFGLTMRNSVIYINISPVMLMLLTLLCYLIISVINRITGKSSHYRLINRLSVTVNGKTVELCAKYDTGNTLKEPFSGSPVIVAEKEMFGDAVNFTELTDNYAAAKIRIVPFSSIGGSGMLPALKAESIIINGNPYNGECYIAFCDKGVFSGGINALLSEDLPV